MKLLVALLLVSFYINSDALFIHKRLGSARPGANGGRNITNTDKQVSSVGQITGTNRGTEQSKKPSNGAKSGPVIDKIGNLNLAAKTQNGHVDHPTGKERSPLAADNAGNAPGNKKVEKVQKPGNNNVENGQKSDKKVENGQKVGKDGKEPRKDKLRWVDSAGNVPENTKVENGQKPDKKVGNVQKPGKKVEKEQKLGKDGKEPKKDKFGFVPKPWYPKVDGNKLENKKAENGLKRGKAGNERVTGNDLKDKVGKENSGKPKFENEKKPRKGDVIIANEKSSNADKLGTKVVVTKPKPNQPVKKTFEMQSVPVVVN